MIDEVMRLKAAMSEAGCRRIADTFDRMHLAACGMSVSKTWVAVLIRTRRLEIEELRRTWKRRIPVAMPANRVWGVDLTGKVDTRGEQRRTPFEAWNGIDPFTSVPHATHYSALGTDCSPAIG